VYVRILLLLFLIVLVVDMVTVGSDGSSCNIFVSNKRNNVVLLDLCWLGSTTLGISQPTLTLSFGAPLAKLALLLAGLTAN
jgi:hypothetical protein